MRIPWRCALLTGAALTAACATHTALDQFPQYLPFGPVPAVLHLGGYAGLGDVDSGSESIHGISGGVGGRLNEHLEMLFRFENGEFAGQGAGSAPNSISDGNQLHLDLGLRGYMPTDGKVRPYFEGYIGYGFADPDRATSDTLGGRSWSVGAGIEFVFNRWFALATGLEYRDTEWRAEIVDDFGRQSLSAQLQFILRLP